MNNETVKDKQWQKPTLIVLVRRKSAEAVLDVCKLEVVQTGPYHISCITGPAPCIEVVAT